VGKTPSVGYNGIGGMKHRVSWLLATASLVAAGCAGGGPAAFSSRGDVSGIVFDSGGYVVPNAKVSFDAGHVAEANKAGVYVLGDLPADNVSIHAEATLGSVRYIGQSVGSVLAGERTKDVNIGIYPADKVGSLEGLVTASDGHPLSGIDVYLHPSVVGASLTNALAVTDSTGHYSFEALQANLLYSVELQTPGSTPVDRGTLILISGEHRKTTLILP